VFWNMLRRAGCGEGIAYFLFYGSACELRPFSTRVNTQTKHLAGNEQYMPARVWAAPGRGGRRTRCGWRMIAPVLHIEALLS